MTSYAPNAPAQDCAARLRKVADRLERLTDAQCDSRRAEVFLSRLTGMTAELESLGEMLASMGERDY